MKLGFRGLLLAAVAIWLVVPTRAFATNGYFLIGYGEKANGMGGVGVAFPQDGLAPAYNPAGMTQVGTRFDMGAELFRPVRCIYHNSATLPVDECSHGQIFLIPNMGGVYQASPRLAYGFAVVGAGLGTSYTQQQANYFFNFQGRATNPAGVSLTQMQILPSVAYKWNRHNSFGASLALAAQVFRAYGLQAFGPAPNGLGFTSNANASNLTNKGPDWSYGLGFRLGWLGKYFHNRLSLGVNYSSKVYMTRFKRYSDLFAQSGSFDIPENYSAGFAVKATRKIDVAMDVEEIRYHDIAAIGDPGPNAANPSDFFSLCPGTNKTPCELGGPQGLGFGWTNQTVYKFGMDYKWDPRLTLRWGVNYGKNPIPANQILFNMLAPGVTEYHLTFGFTRVTHDALTKYLGGKEGEVTMSYQHAFTYTLRGPTAFGPSGSVVNGTNASIAMKQDAIGVSYGIKF